MALDPPSHDLAGRPRPGRPRSGRLPTTLRLSAAERRALGALAARRGLPLGALCRAILLAAVETDRVGWPLVGIVTDPLVGIVTDHATTPQTRAP